MFLLLFAMLFLNAGSLLAQDTRTSYSKGRAIWSAVDPWDEDDSYTATWTYMPDYSEPCDNWGYCLRYEHTGLVSDDTDIVYRLQYTYGRVRAMTLVPLYPYKDYTWEFRFQEEHYPSTSTFWADPDKQGEYWDPDLSAVRRYYAYAWHWLAAYSAELYDGHTTEIKLYHRYQDGARYLKKFNFEHEHSVIVE